MTAVSAFLGKHPPLTPCVPRLPGHPRLGGRGVCQEPAQTPHPSTQSPHLHGQRSLQPPLPRLPCTRSCPGSSKHPKLFILLRTTRITPNSARDLELGGRHTQAGNANSPSNNTKNPLIRVKGEREDKDGWEVVPSLIAKQTY